MSRRVVITGMGINSCIGNTLEDVQHSLEHGISGTRHNSSYAELNFKSHVSLQCSGRCGQSCRINY